jgi:hypothetical protein
LFRNFLARLPLTTNHFRALSFRIMLLQGIERLVLSITREGARILADFL